MRTGAGLYLFLATHLSMLSDVKAYTEYKDQQMIRYKYEEDYPTKDTYMDTWEDASAWCISKGLKLATWEQLCPDGLGPGNVPVGGMIDGSDQYVAVQDDAEIFIQIDSYASTGSECGDKCTSCRGHLQAYAHNPTWGSIGGEKKSWFNNYVFCHVEPTPNPIEEAVGNGCTNAMKLSHTYINGMMRTPCDECAFCAGSSLNDILIPDINSMCVVCTENTLCNSLRIITSFNTPWVMKYFSLSPSEMSVDSDPEMVVLEGSNNLQDWTSLYETSIETSWSFGSRSESEDFVFSHNTVPYKHYAVTFVRSFDFSTMYVGHYGIVESYTKQCASNIFNDITGNDVVPYKEVV